MSTVTDFWNFLIAQLTLVPGSRETISPHIPRTQSHSFYSVVAMACRKQIPVKIRNKSPNSFIESISSLRHECLFN